MGMEARSLTRMLKTMEDKKWIYRQKDENDGRSVRIYLTDLGKEKRAFSSRAVKEFNSKIRELVSEDEIKSFIEVTKAVTQLIENKNLFDKLAEAFIYETKH